MSTTLIIPGLKSSGPAHWQTWLEGRIAGAVRVHQQNSNDPHLPDWSGRVRRAITRTEGDVYLVAHSFGSLAAVQAAADHAARISGALLVAPAEPEFFGIADYLPRHALPFPTIVVASSNDLWMSNSSAEAWADRWGADFINLGDAGHINTETGFGPWPEALTLLERLRRAHELKMARERRAALRLARGDRSLGAGRCGAALLEPAGWQIRRPNTAQA